jgi:hypothetical protein
VPVCAVGPTSASTQKALLRARSAKAQALPAPSSPALLTFAKSATQSAFNLLPTLPAALGGAAPAPAPEPAASAPPMDEAIPEEVSSKTDEVPDERIEAHHPCCDPTTSSLTAAVARPPDHLLLAGVS